MVAFAVIYANPPYVRGNIETQIFDSVSVPNEVYEWCCYPSFKECKKDYYLTKRINNRNDIETIFYCSIYDYKLFFEPGEVIAFCNSSISRLRKTSGEKDSILQYRHLIRLATRSSLSTHVEFDNSWMQALIPRCKPFIKNIRSKKYSKALIVRFYKTQNNSGKDFDVITSKNDTLNMVTVLPFCHN